MADFEPVVLLSTTWVKTMFVCVGTVYLIFPIITAKLLFDFYPNRHHPLILKRYPKIITTFTVGTILQGFANTLAVIGIPNVIPFLLPLSPFFFISGSVVILGSITIRFWLIRFDTKFAQIGLSKHWQLLIDSKSNENNWYYQHKHTLGNPQFVSRLVFTLFSILGLIVLLVTVYGMTVGWIIEIGVANIVLFAIPLGVIMYSHKTINPMDDDFFILQELNRYVRAINGIGLSLVLCLGTALLIVTLNGWNDKSSKHYSLTKERECMATGMMTFFAFVNCCALYMVYTSTRWVSIKLKLLMNTKGGDSSENSSENSSSGTNLSSKGSSKSGNRSATTTIGQDSGNTKYQSSLYVKQLSAQGLNKHETESKENIVVSDKDNDEVKAKKLNDKIRKITVSKIFNNKRALTVFFQHLSNEFSMEIGLSLIEFIQYLNYIVTIFDLQMPKSMKKQQKNSIDHTSNDKNSKSIKNSKKMKKQNKDKSTQHQTPQSTVTRDVDVVGSTSNTEVAYNKPRTLTLDLITRSNVANSQRKNSQGSQGSQGSQARNSPRSPSDNNDTNDNNDNDTDVENDIDDNIRPPSPSPQTQTQSTGSKNFKYSQRGDSASGTGTGTVTTGAYGGTDFVVSTPNEIVLEMTSEDKDSNIEIAWNLMKKFTFFKKIAQSEIITKYGGRIKLKNNSSKEDEKTNDDRDNGDGLKSGLSFGINISGANGKKINRGRKNSGNNGGDYEENIRNCKLIAYDLYCKYIAEGRSDFEININWLQRQRLTNIIGNKERLLRMHVGQIDENDLLVLFVPCVQEMRKLLGYSLSRLRLKHDMFAELEAVILKQLSP